jgi:uncharacterized protein (DUF2267 family)
MKYDDFVGQVQNKAKLATSQEAIKAIRATLQTLAERIVTGEAQNLAAQLPQEIGDYVREVEKDEQFSLDTFFKRVAEREGVDEPDAVYHARAVMTVVSEAVTEGEMEDVREQLPMQEYAPLFESV